MSSNTKNSFTNSRKSMQQKTHQNSPITHYYINMRTIILSLLLVSLFSSGCNKEKECTPVPASAEESQMQAYATANGLTAVKHSSGLYYQVTNPGTGATPTINSKVTVTYTGKLLNGTVFDQVTYPAVTFPLSGVIEGWQLGIPLIKKGGKIKLIIPSSLAYGCTGVSTIPGNSVLYFDIDLVDVQ
jgi:FKBP-type peptidyl-prolyl cis-trans isomerase FkpA